MNKEIESCTVCSNKNAVLVSSGFKTPANKGKKYFTCAGCQTFQWVGADGPYLPEGSKPALSAQPVAKATVTQGNPKSSEDWQQSLGEPKPAQQVFAQTLNFDERSRRIERQHSQTAALEYLELKGITEFTKEDLIKTINWFAKDIDRTVNDPIPEPKKKSTESEGSEETDLEKETEGITEEITGEDEVNPNLPF